MEEIEDRFFRHQSLLSLTKRRLRVEINRPRATCNNVRLSKFREEERTWSCSLERDFSLFFPRFFVLFFSCPPSPSRSFSLLPLFQFTSRSEDPKTQREPKRVALSARRRGAQYARRLSDASKFTLCVPTRRNSFREGADANVPMEISAFLDRAVLTVLFAMRVSYS